MSNVLREVVQPGLIRLVLNRPDAFNALSESMLADLGAELKAISSDASVRVVVLAAQGKAFCAGHDLREMRASPSEDYYQRLFNQCTDVMMTIQQMPQPVIAEVQGVATAAGCQLVAMCDLAVASEKARFAVSGINLGLFCATPSVPLSRNLSRKQALELLLTGDFLSAEGARERGLINQVVPAEALTDAALALAQKILAKPEAAVRMGKQLFYRQLEVGIEQAYAMAGSTMACNMMEPDTLEGVQAFIEKRPPNWQAQASEHTPTAQPKGQAVA
ncbi:CaiD Enoyl-CoA hydratase/carnithine racemase [Burkholderiales bacterium]